MNSPSSPSCFSSLTDVRAKLKSSIDSTNDRIPLKNKIYVFFRADDVAVPSKRFARLIELFAKYKIPLALAIVPAWLTEPRWKNIQNLLKKDMDLWCLHQHGWRHINYEKKDKKQEFGLSRTKSQKISDIIRGKQRLESIMEKDFFPIFTPPWNRCDQDTLHALRDLNYCAVSGMNKKSFSKDILPDFSVHVDLHTRRENNSYISMDNLFRELQNSLSRGLCGIMIHHQKMNDFDFHLLEILFQCLRDKKDLEIVNVKDLINRHGD